MGKFDNIDIFFIAIISAYFITLACIILAFVIIGIKNIFLKVKMRSHSKVKNNIIPENKLNIIPKEEVKKTKTKNKSEKTRRKLSEIPIIQKLFMKKVSPTKITKETTPEIPVKTKEQNKDIILTKDSATIKNTNKTNTNKDEFSTETKLKKQKSDLEKVIEQINKADKKEDRKTKETEKQLPKENKAVREDTKKREQISDNKTKTPIQTKDKPNNKPKTSNNSNVSASHKNVSKTNSKTKTSKPTNNNKSTSNKPNTKKNSTPSNNKNKTKTKNSQNKKKQTNNSKKSSTTTKKKTTKKKTVKRKKS